MWRIKTTKDGIWLGRWILHSATQFHPFSTLPWDDQYPLFPGMTNTLYTIGPLIKVSAGFANAVIGPQIHLLVFDASPQTLDEHVVAPSALAIHADRYSPVGKRAGERRAGELAALIGVEDFRLAVTS